MTGLLVAVIVLQSECTEMNAIHSLELLPVSVRTKVRFQEPEQVKSNLRPGGSVELYCQVCVPSHLPSVH